MFRGKRQTGSRSCATFLVSLPPSCLKPSGETHATHLAAVGKRNEADIPIEATGEMYTHVFGSTATPFERFVVDRKIMGPCWLKVKSPQINKGDAVSAPTRLRRIVRSGPG